MVAREPEVRFHANFEGAPVAPFNGRLWQGIVIAGLIVLAAGLSGCGRRGPLEAPPSAAAVQPDGTAAPADEGKPAKPDKPFLLDPLIH
jgi:predicted small lipoprotein YifL